jgi:CRP-like cAMP-binding protein
MDTREFIRSLPLFKGLSEEQIEILAKSAREKKVRAGRLIIGEEDTTRTFYVVAEGRVKMSKSTYEGKEQTLYLLGPGDLFGLCAAFSDTVFPTNAMALEESKILIFPGEVIEPLSQQDPQILFNMIFALSRKLKGAMALIESLSLKEIPQRIAAFLLFHASGETDPRADVIELPVTQRELAKLLGTTPETLSRELKKMTADGMITIRNRTVTIVDREALEDLSGL